MRYWSRKRAVLVIGSLIGVGITIFAGLHYPENDPIDLLWWSPLLIAPFAIAFLVKDLSSGGLFEHPWFRDKDV
jgi:hypothetical protein